MMGMLFVFRLGALLANSMLFLGGQKDSRHLGSLVKDLKPNVEGFGAPPLGSLEHVPTLTQAHVWRPLMGSLRIPVAMWVPFN